MRGKWKTRECEASGVDIRLLLDPLTAQHASLAPVSGRIRMPLAPSCGAHITHLESGEATDASLEKNSNSFLLCNHVNLSTGKKMLLAVKGREERQEQLYGDVYN